MTDLPVFRKDQLDSAQKSLWDKLTMGARGFYTGGVNAKRLPDLYNAWLQFPEFGHTMLQLGDAIRAQPELTGTLRELVVLTTSSTLDARVEYDFHVPFAKGQGLSDAVISAIGAGEIPTFPNEDERIVYEANIQLLRNATLTDRTREDVVKVIGHEGLMQLIAAVGLYVITAYTTNVAKVELAKDFSADPGELKTFYAGQHAG